MSFHVPETCRVRGGINGSDASYGNNGAFVVRHGGMNLRIIASDGGGWEHVSVSLPNRVPTWDEMCYIKNLFWDGEDTVMQLHPAKSQYVNHHPFCLHLWRPTDEAIPTPPMIFVGPQKTEVAR